MYIDLHNGIDGSVPIGTLPPTGCCPPPICEVSVEAIKCSMVSLLPNGPLWDRPKEAGYSCDSNCTPVCYDGKGEEEELCGSLVSHAVYSARKLYYFLINAVWPSLRESRPETAFDTMDDWLDRLGWIDCYNSYCRSADLGEMTPYEILGPCGIEYCPPTFSDALARVYKRGLILALWRLRNGVIANLASINFVIAPLYAELVLDHAYGTAPDVPKCLILRTTAETAPVVIKDPCPVTSETLLAASKNVNLWLSPGNGLCAGGPRKAYPLVLAAHCIVRSLLPTCCNICIVRQP